jgi:hypothetical protein
LIGRIYNNKIYHQDTKLYKNQCCHGRMESVPHSSLSSMRPLQPDIGCRSGRLSTGEERVRGCWDADHRLPRHACARHTCGAGNHRHNSPRERCLKWRELALRINCGRCSFSHTKQLPTFVASQSLTWQSAVSSQTTSNSVAPELNCSRHSAVRHFAYPVCVEQIITRECSHVFE